MRALAYDVTLKKVGCVLLQAAMGGDSALASDIDTEAWLFTPTPGLRLYRLSDDEATALVAFHRAQRTRTSGRRGSSPRSKQQRLTTRD